jgi:hypothetical protein
VSTVRMESMSRKDVSIDVSNLPKLDEKWIISGYDITKEGANPNLWKIERYMKKMQDEEVSEKIKEVSWIWFMSL